MAHRFRPPTTQHTDHSPLPTEVAKCPDEAFRKGLLELADKTIELTHGAEHAYAARASLRAAFGLPEEPSPQKEQPGKTE